MPWKCPACQTPLNHDGDTWRPGRVYRCHVCRLELVLDEASNDLMVAPLPADSTPTKQKRRTKDPNV
jgi:hypothetical protein